MVAILVLLIMVSVAAVVTLVIWPKRLLLKVAKLIQEDQEDPLIKPWLAHLTKVTNAALMSLGTTAYGLDMRRQEAKALKAPKRCDPDVVAELIQWRVPDRVSLSAILKFENILNSATDERPLQRALEMHPEILTSFTWGHNGVYAIPQSRLGNQYVPDFLIAADTSLGLLWTLIELESPTARLTIADGQHSKELRKAIKQITDWREWLSDNSDYARRGIKDNGLGMPGIRSDARAVIIISRADRSVAPDRLRMRELSERNIEIRTYDWLIRSFHMLFPSGYPTDTSLLVNGSVSLKFFIDRLRETGEPPATAP